ncbi:MAG: class IV adenylate cyclase [Patescibacteria group bacterium]|nr:class IV adenylate cyclase [Patescibacteria group bacterium]
MPHINIEIKAKCENPDSIREFLRSNDADSRGLDHQIDTYFKVANGRLKLREGDIENFLIYYERPDQEGPKQADVILFKTESRSPLKEMLSRSLGELVTVDKKREIYFLDNVKFHIDTVEGLGAFMEIEAIDYGGTLGKEKLLEQCQDYLRELNIPKDDLISMSYSDLLLAKKD